MPSWGELYAVAAGQEGLFTPEDAAAAGYSLQLLQKHLHAGRIARRRRGLYRLVHFPPGEHEDLVDAWLWSQREGVFSHETALGLHALSDALPATIHLTLPTSWRARRKRREPALVIAYRDIPNAGQTWVGPVPVTTIAETIRDCLRDHVSPELVGAAIEDALHRGQISAEVAAALRDGASS